MITIAQPAVVESNGKSRLQADIDIDGRTVVIWIEVESDYREYLCFERSDAFVIGLLSFAMRNGHDITCVAPLGERLYYNLTSLVIDAVCKGGDHLHRVAIHAQTDASEFGKAIAVGTGISCGIDSFHVLARHTHLRERGHNVTHLAFNNVGSHGQGRRAAQLFDERRINARKFAEEFGFNFVESNSNIHDAVPQDHLLTHTYTSLFAVYALQKLYKVYYYASGVTIFDFSLKGNEQVDCAYYDFLLTSMLSTPALAIYSDGAASSRLEKTREVMRFAPSYGYLNVCLFSSSNCGRCEKCVRTLLALDALGGLELYDGVFDIAYYKANRRHFDAVLFRQVLSGNKNYLDAYALLRARIGFDSKLIGFGSWVWRALRDRVPSGGKRYLKRLYEKVVGSPYVRAID